ncbi:hypothetical protein ANCDUO_13355, partial [Ancylostoma duodenale]
MATDERSCSSTGKNAPNIVIDEPHLSEFFTFLQDLRAEGKFCDVEILVGGQSIKAHKLVLMFSIPYFRTMFTTDMKEVKQKQVRLC